MNNVYKRDISEETRKRYPQHTRVYEQRTVLAGAREFLQWLQKEGLQVVLPYGSSIDVSYYAREKWLLAQFVGVDLEKLKQEQAWLHNAITSGFATEDDRLVAHEQLWYPEP